MHCLSKIWYRLLNKNHGFIRQLTIKEMRSWHYRDMYQRLAKGQITHSTDTRNVHQEETNNLHPPTASTSKSVYPGDPSKRYQIAKTHTSSYHLGQWLHENQGDPALHVSPGFPVKVYYLSNTTTGLSTSPPQSFTGVHPGASIYRRQARIYRHGPWHINHQA